MPTTTHLPSDLSEALRILDAIHVHEDRKGEVTIVQPGLELAKSMSSYMDAWKTIHRYAGEK